MALGERNDGRHERDEQEEPLMGRHPEQTSHPSHHHSSSVAQQVEMSNGRRRPLKATEKMWVIATTSLISFLAFSSQIFVLIPYWRSTPTVTRTQIFSYLVPFNCGVALIFYNYYLVVVTNPGDVPPSWEPDWDSIGGVEVKASTGAPRYCKVCRSYKPPRAHHCRTCRRCVLRMDHHCPWVANCVGHGNYGHFLRFLWAVDITMIMHLALLGLRVADWWSPFVYWREPSTAAMVIMVLNFAQGAPVLLMVGVFSLYHTYALCTNTTTIESWEKDKVATLIRRGKIEEVKYPYDLGVTANVQSILGKSPLKWCLPGQKPLGNGLDYLLGDGHEHVEQFLWPPRDPTRPQRQSNHRDASGRRKRRFQLPSEGPFTYGEGNFNPALRPSNIRQTGEAAATTQKGSQPGTVNQGLRQRTSPHSEGDPEYNPAAAGVAGIVGIAGYGDGSWSNVSPYHPDYGQPYPSGRRGSTGSVSSSVSSAEEAGVVDAGCIPPGTIPGSGRRPAEKDRDRRQRRRRKSDDDGDEGDSNAPEEHELMDARERRKWGAQSGELFPRLFPEEEEEEEEEEADNDDQEDTESSDAMGSEGYDSEEGAGDGRETRTNRRGPQLHSRVRRGSEGYEVRPMMYDEAYAAEMREEEERLRDYLMAEQERLGQVWDPDDPSSIYTAEQGLMEYRGSNQGESAEESEG